MEALTLTRNEYTEALEQINQGINEGSYLSQFKITLPDGLNKANSLEICRLMQAPTLEAKVRLMKILVAGKKVEVICPNGDKESFCLTKPEDSLEGFPLFEKEPLAQLAIADTLYGYLIKKYVRLSKTQIAAKE